MPATYQFPDEIEVLIDTIEPVVPCKSKTKSKKVAHLISTYDDLVKLVLRLRKEKDDLQRIVELHQEAQDEMTRLEGTLEEMRRERVLRKKMTDSSQQGQYIDHLFRASPTPHESR